MVPTSAHARPRDRWTEHSNRWERLRLRLRLRCSVTWESVGWSLPVTVTPYPRKGRPTRIAAHTIPMRSVAFEREPSSSIAYVSTHQRKHAFTFVVRGGFKRADRACTSTDRSLHRYKRRHRACDIISKQRHRQRHRQQHQHITRCCNCDHISASQVCFKPVKACTQQCASRTFRSCTSMFDGPVCIIPQVSSR